MIVKVRPKLQITIPDAVCKQAGIRVGDILEVKVGRDGRLVLTAKVLVDRKAA